MSRLFISALALFASLLSAQEIHTLVSDGDYLAFPAVIELEDEVLVSFKRGKAHAADAGATQELLRLDKASGKVLATGTLAAVKGEIMQMGEWVFAADGIGRGEVEQRRQDLRAGAAGGRDRWRGVWLCV
jgi:hypothetical protein